MRHAIIHRIWYIIVSKRVPDYNAPQKVQPLNDPLKDTKSARAFIQYKDIILSV